MGRASRGGRVQRPSRRRSRGHGDGLAVRVACERACQEGRANPRRTSTMPSTGESTITGAPSPTLRIPSRRTRSPRTARAAHGNWDHLASGGDGDVTVIHHAASRQGVDLHRLWTPPPSHSAPVEASPGNRLDGPPRSSRLERPLALTQAPRTPALGRGRRPSTVRTTRGRHHNGHPQRGRVRRCLRSTNPHVTTDHGPRPWHQGWHQKWPCWPIHDGEPTSGQYANRLTIPSMANFLAYFSRCLATTTRWTWLVPS